MQAIVDRIEGNIAVLELDGNSYIDVPLSEMPEGCSKGDVYKGEPGFWIKDADAKAERLEININLMKQLFRS